MTSDARRRPPVPESCPPRPRLDGPRRAGPPRAGRPGTAERRGPASVVAEEKRTHWPSRWYLPSAVAAVEAEQRAQNRAGSWGPRRGVAPWNRSVCCRALLGKLRRSRRGSGRAVAGSRAIRWRDLPAAGVRETVRRGCRGHQAQRDLTGKRASEEAHPWSRGRGRLWKSRGVRVSPVETGLHAVSCAGEPAGRARPWAAVSGTPYRLDGARNGQEQVAPALDV